MSKYIVRLKHLNIFQMCMCDIYRTNNVRLLFIVEEHTKLELKYLYVVIFTDSSVLQSNSEEDLVPPT